jgi:hypothetical protein
MTNPWTAGVNLLCHLFVSILGGTPGLFLHLRPKRSGGMWLWESELRERGFRRKSERYWQCQRRYGMPDAVHLSIFSWSEQTLPGVAGQPHYLVELTEFHLTFVRAGEHLHFYYHEHGDNLWHPGGHTSLVEIQRLGLDLATLRDEADAIARTFVEALGGVLLERGARNEAPDAG